MDIKDLQVICGPTTCIDLRNPDFDFLEDIAGNGVVTDSSMTVEVKKEWLSYDENKGISAIGGGSLNVAPLIALAGGRAGICTSLGESDRGYDIIGQQVLKICAQTGVMPIVIASEKPSSVSFVRPETGDKREAILHCPNSVDSIDLTEKAAKDELKQQMYGTVFHYMYSGLSDTMDQPGKLSGFLKWLGERGVFRMADTHTYAKRPREAITKKQHIPKYELLREALPHLEFFFCSQDEARMIANTFGYDISHSDPTEVNARFLEKLASEFMRGKDPRIIGVTTGTSAYMMYKYRMHKVTVEVPSNYVVTNPENLVGAGDAFRAGFLLEWIKNPQLEEAFHDHRIKFQDLENLARIGHMMAAIHVTRDKSNPYAGIPLYENMRAVDETNQTFTSRDALLEACHPKNF